jgi:glycosyltransferase involved in cell wall biosynthesis
MVFSSTIIPTVNRPTLGRAVQSVLDQEFAEADFEVIVVNDSGAPLPDADWRREDRVRVIDVPRRERCVCRNVGAAVARGRYLHFLDDDDVLLPGAMQSFWDLDRASPERVSWLYGGYQTVDNEGRITQEFRPELEGNIFAALVAGEGIPFQVSLLDNRQFFLAGGFDTTPALLGVEDRDAGRRMALGGHVVGTRALVAQIRIGEQGSTTNWAILAEGDRVGREKALSAPEAGARLRDSAKTSYWRGRVARAYAGSLVWNLRRRAWTAAASRGLAGLAVAGGSALAPGFWQGVRTRIT